MNKANRRQVKDPSTNRVSDSTPARMEILSRVEGYFTRHGRPRRGSRILVAVSGGPDSGALLAILVELAARHKWTLGVAHVNHGLRGADATGDELFVRQLAHSLGLRFHCRHLHPALRPPQSNLQSWARVQRYAFFEKTASRSEYSHVALAHQLNDRAETVAAAVLDGSGTFALGGIPPVRGMIIRPLFDVSRDMIERFLGEGGIAFRIDGSNESPKYQRNRIRREILPAWERENPGIILGLARLGEQVWLQRRYLEIQAERIVVRALTGRTHGALTLDVRKLIRYDEALDPHVLRFLIDRIGLDVVPRPTTVARFTELRRKLSGSAAVEQGKLAIMRSQQVLKVFVRRTRVAGRAISQATTPELTTRVVEMPKTLQNDDRLVARFDMDALEGGLSVRWPQSGDRYRPIGLQGTKKLFDLLADRKVPSFERPLVPIVVDHQGILWPVGHPIAHRARLTNRTRRVLEARLEEGSWKSRS